MVNEKPLRDRPVAIIARAELKNERNSGKRPYEFAALLMEQLVIMADRANRLGLEKAVYPVAYGEITEFAPADNTPDIIGLYVFEPDRA